jgi:hypothetical protein
MARSTIAIVASAFAVALALAACGGTDPYNPGEPVGQFHVTATLKSTTCGPAPNPWQFDVKLRHDRSSVMYWVQGGLPVKGNVDTNSRATFSATDTRTLRDANAKTGTAACAVTRTDALDVSLATGSTPAVDVASTTAFVGTLAYDFAPVAGSDCSDQLLSTNGDYEALPCTIQYDLTAERTKDLPK